VEKRERQIPIEIQQQPAVDLDEKMGGVKPLASGQYGELGPGFEQLLDQLVEEKGADEATKRHLIPNPHEPQPRSS
jgi:hypothetical protein